MVVKRANIFGNRHFIVVEDHQHIRTNIARVIHRFKRHACGNRAVANHTDGAAILPSFSAATAIPIPALMEVDECPTLNTSYSLSPRHGTGVDRLSDGWCRFCRGVRSKFYADKPDAPHPKSIGQTGCYRHSAAPRSVRPCPARRRSARWNGSRCRVNSGAVRRRVSVNSLWQQS